MHLQRNVKRKTESKGQVHDKLPTETLYASKVASKGMESKSSPETITHEESVIKSHTTIDITDKIHALRGEKCLARCKTDRTL